jgi:penicillin V acylase-like amidase (Ntn superfamily)
MKLPTAIVSAAIALGLVPIDPSLACSTFALQTEYGTLFGRNTDGPASVVIPGMVVINKRGIRKTAAPWKDIGPAGDPATAAKWTSRYGSLTFTHFGREFPDGGVNEAGLIVEEMSLDETQYPSLPGNPSVAVQQWIQYQLDNYSTVAEVVANAERLNIHGWPWHFTLADRSGACTLLEFTHGKALVGKGTLANGCVLTNGPINEDTDRLKAALAKDEATPRDSASDSFSRFERANFLLKKPTPKMERERADYAFDVLARISQGSQTFRSIVYDLGANRVYFRSYRHPKIKYIDLTRIDFSSMSQVLAINLETPAAGDVTTKLQPYSALENRKVVEGVFRLIRATPAVSKSLDQELAGAGKQEADYIDWIADYPSTTRVAASTK